MDFWRKVDQKDTCNFKNFKSWLERYIQLSFMHVCKYLNQKARRIDELNGKSFNNVSKTKKKKTWGYGVS